MTSDDLADSLLPDTAIDLVAEIPTANLRSVVALQPAGTFAERAKVERRIDVLVRRMAALLQVPREQVLVGVSPDLQRIAVARMPRPQQVLPFLGGPPDERRLTAELGIGSTARAGNESPSETQRREQERTRSRRSEEHTSELQSH